MLESIGQRIARMRAEKNWTQERLAARIGVSRVAISHIEMGLSIPSERTIALLAGSFRCSPHELVADTTYPEAKAERLPEFVAWYSERDQQLALLKRDLLWLGRVEDGLTRQKYTAQMKVEWLPLLHRWSREVLDEVEKQEIDRLLESLLASD